MQTTAVRNKHIGWSLSARHTGTQGPCDGHRVPVLWGDFWAIYLSKRL